MSKYLVTSGSYFEPFTYDQIAAPVREAAEIHRATQDVYDQISTDAEALRRYIEQEPEDSNARAMYNSYMDKLSTLQNNLWSNGYNTQTRRDLSSARAGYASDVSRLGAAIQTRQQRSAEYWKTKHDHPDMIMGTDPGLAGLDNYLANDLYGQNYYSYSGHDFMNQVGADAKARANEMLNDPDVRKNPVLTGYLEVISRDGFSSADVANASAAVRGMLNGDTTIAQQLDPASSILADILMNHLESTGAAGNVDDSEFNRLFDYGVAGLSQAIGKTSVNTVNDKMWDFSKQVALANMKSSSGSTVAANDTSRPYSLDDISTFVKSKTSDKITSKLNKTFVEPFKESLVAKDGTVIASPMDADNILISFGRDKLLSKYGGIDPDHPETANGNILLGQGKTEIRAVKNDVNDFDMSFVNEPYTIEIKDGKKWVKDAQMTKEFNRDRKEYQDKVTSWKKDNPNIDLPKLALTGSKRQELNKLGGISPDTPLEFLPYILATQAGVGNIPEAQIAAPTPSYAEAREAYAGLLQDSYNRASSMTSKIDRTSESAFYPIENGTISEKGVPIESVKGKKNEFYLSSAHVFPEDLAQNRVRVNINGKEYAVNPKMLGNVFDKKIQDMRQPVSIMMSPLTDPAKAVRMSPEEEIAWITTIQDNLGSYFPVVYVDNTGSTAFVEPIDIITNPALQELLRNSITQYMNSGIAAARDYMLQNNMRVRGKTSEKATGYNIEYTGR